MVVGVVADEDEVVVTVEGNVGVTSHVGVVGERGREVSSGGQVLGNSSLLVAGLGLERAETSTSGDDGSSQDACSDLAGNVVSVPGELSSSNGSNCIIISICITKQL